MNLQTLMEVAVYHDGGRGPVLFDCWGWIRYVRHYLQGQALLTSWGQVRVEDLRSATRAWGEQLVDLEECPAEPGAIAHVHRSGLMVHVGTVIAVDGALHVSDITPAGARLLLLYDFESQYLKVSYYRDRTSTDQGAGAPRDIRQPIECGTGRCHAMALWPHDRSLDADQRAHLRTHRDAASAWPRGALQH